MSLYVLFKYIFYLYIIRHVIIWVLLWLMLCFVGEFLVMLPEFGAFISGCCSQSQIYLMATKIDAIMHLSLQLISLSQYHQEPLRELQPHLITFGWISGWNIHIFFRSNVKTVGDYWFICCIYKGKKNKTTESRSQRQKISLSIQINSLVLNIDWCNIINPTKEAEE